jgi:starch-binding outer membrane protein SusE/F
MKTILRNSIFALAALAFGSCSVEDNNNTPIASASGAPKLLSPASGNTFVLSRLNASNVISTFVWDFSSNGVDSPATYSIEVAKAGTKFQAPKVAASSQNKYIALTHEQLNNALDPAVFPAFFEGNAEVRIKSSLGNGVNAVVQYSNAIQIKVTPYRVPAATSIWLVGAATPGGWTWSGDSETELPLISAGVYEVNVILKQDNAFRVFYQNDGTDNGNWGSGKNYPSYIADGYTISAELVNASDGDSNFKYTGATGVRVFKIDTNAKTITLN